MSDSSNRLAMLAAEIRAAHEESTGTGVYSAERALDAGRWLMDAKSSTKHDGTLALPLGTDWRRWVEDKAGVPYSTAQLYIRNFLAVEEGLITLEIIADKGQILAAKEAAGEKTRRRRAESRAAMPLPDGMELRIGDCRIVLADIADNSVPLILTDPPYGEEAEPLYAWLAQWAERVLIPGGSLICFTGQSMLRRDLALFHERRGLRYWWTLAMLHTQSQMIPGKFVRCGYKPVLWYAKEKRRNRFMVDDVLRSPRREKEMHEWGQGEGGVNFLIEGLTEPGELILDPFAGTATWGTISVSMGRRWIGADIAIGGTTAVVAA